MTVRSWPLWAGPDIFLPSPSRGDSIAVRGLAPAARRARPRIVQRLLLWKFADGPVVTAELRPADVRRFIAEQLQLRIGEWGPTRFPSKIAKIVSDPFFSEFDAFLRFDALFPVRVFDRADVADEIGQLDESLRCVPTGHHHVE